MSTIRADFLRDANLQEYRRQVGLCQRVPYLFVVQLQAREAAPSFHVSQVSLQEVLQTVLKLCDDMHKVCDGYKTLTGGALARVK